MKPAWILLGLLPVAAPAQSRPVSLAPLVRDSPFLPRPGAAAAESGPAQFEFRGLVFENGGYSFSVYDQGRRYACWLRLDEPDHSLVARRFDPAKETLTIEQNGLQLTLPLKRAKVQALAAGAPAPLPTAVPVPPNPAAAPPPAPAAVNNAQEAQRLQSIADEIRRRRGLRQLPPNPGRP